VDLTEDAEEEERMDEAPAKPPPTVSSDEIETDEEEDLLAYHGLDRQDDSSSDYGFQHVFVHTSYQRRQGSKLLITFFVMIGMWTGCNSAPPCRDTRLQHFYFLF